MPDNSDTIWSLQALRALAALGIIIAHLKFPLEAVYGPLNLPGPLRGAGFACGVDLFFVLSGFVISMTAARRHPTAGVFIKQRVIRIMPLYLILSLPYFVGVVRSGFKQGDMPYRQLWNSVMMVPVFDKFSINEPVHPFGWTLCFEMWFYTLFTLLLLVVSGRRIPWLMVVIFTLAAPVPFFWNLNWKFPYFAFHPLCWEFAMGCLAFELTRRVKPSAMLAGFLLLLGAVALAFGAVLFERLGWHGRIRMVPEDSALRAGVWGVPAFLIVVSAVWLEPWISSLKGLRIFCFLGAASYSIYLVQPLVFDFLGKWFLVTRFMPWQLFSLVVILASLLAGSLVHLFLERPITAFLRRVGCKKVFP